VQGAQYFLPLQFSFTKARSGMTTQIIHREKTLPGVANQYFSAVYLNTQYLTQINITDGSKAMSRFIVQWLFSCFRQEFIQRQVHATNPRFLVIAQCKAGLATGLEPFLLQIEITGVFIIDGG